MKDKVRLPREIARRNVKYEIKMFNFAVDIKLEHLDKKKHKKIRDKKDDFLGSIYTDSILLHVRNLFKFFNSEDGAKAKDYLNNNWKPTKFKTIDKCIITKINLYRSHISKKRKIGTGKPIWEKLIEDMRYDIAEVYEEFREQLSAKELKNWPIWETLIKIQ